MSGSIIKMFKFKNTLFTARGIRFVLSEMEEGDIIECITFINGQHLIDSNKLRKEKTP